MFIRTLVLAFLTLTLTACNITGSGQKGPFKSGSAVSSSQLDSQALTIASTTISTQVKNNKGHFSIDQIPWNGWTEIVVSGQYFDEYNNTDSDQTLTLNTITRKDRRFDKANMHLFSHLAAARIRHHVANSQNINDAWKDTQTEMSQTFGLSQVSSDYHHGVEQLSLLQGSGSFNQDNANLLLFTGGFLAAGGDSAMLDALTHDFADDAEFNGDGASAFNAITSAAAATDLLQTLSQNLISNGANNPPNEEDMLQLPIWVNTDTTANTPPIADAGADVTVEVNSSVTMTGSGTDSDGSIVSYEWTEGSAVISSSAEFSYTPTTPGTHTLVLTVTDDDDATASDSVIVEATDIIVDSIVSGIITLANGNPVNAATIKVYKENVLQPETATSDSTGNYSLTLDPNSNYTLVVVQEGYAAQVQQVSTLAANIGITANIILTEEGLVQSFNQIFDSMTNPNPEFTLAGKYGTSVVITASTFVDSASSTVTDDITLTITPVDTSTQAGLSAFPGSFSGVFDGQATPSSMYALGVAEFKFINSVTNEAINLASGETANVTIPLFNIAKPDGTSLVIGDDNVPLLSLDEISGTWTQEATGSVIALATSPTGLGVSADVSHFSWWSIGFSPELEPGNVQAFADISVIDPLLSGYASIKARTNADVSYTPNVSNLNFGSSETVIFPGWSDTETCFWAEFILASSVVVTPEQCITSPIENSTYPLEFSIDNSSGFSINNSISLTAVIGELSPSYALYPNTLETNVSYTVTSGTLPAGVTLTQTSSTSAIINGTPTTGPGTFTVGITAVDSESNTQVITLTYTVDDTPSAAPSFFVGTAAGTMPNSYEGFDTLNINCSGRACIHLDTAGFNNFTLDLAPLNIGAMATTWTIVDPFEGFGSIGDISTDDGFVPASNEGVSITNSGILGINKPATSTTTFIHVRLEATNSLGSDTIEVDLNF